MFPLHLAVLYGFSDCCRKLLSSGTDSFNQWVFDLHIHPPVYAPVSFFPPPSGQLYSIVSSMSKEHVLSAGFDINTPDNFGRTCLHAAASGG